MKPKITVALTGNPNSWKTTIFNELTGAHQHEGKNPDVTVVRKAVQLMELGAPLDLAFNMIDMATSRG